MRFSAGCTSISGKGDLLGKEGNSPSSILSERISSMLAISSEDMSSIVTFLDVLSVFETFSSGELSFCGDLKSRS